MSQQELIIDYDYYEGEQCSFDDLKEASDRLTSATQEQFEQIKKEKWFNRVFDMVTLANTHEKRMANQIGNLAQAQQIIMEILVRLSERDARISDLVADAFDKIEKLSRNDVLLAKSINLLEKRCILGISKETDIGDLSETEREILGGLFFSLMHHFEKVSEDQRRYANNVLNYLDVGAQDIDIQASLASINHIEVKKKLLTCCLEYSFLNNYNFNLQDDINEIIDEFDFGNKTIREVKNKITAIYNLRGVDGFIDKYGNYDECAEEFHVEMPDFTFEDEVTELQEINITSILYIPSDETRVFKNNIVHISAYIKCDGHLEFENCVVNYNEYEASDEITLSQGASINFLNCQVNCLAIDTNSFIQGQGNNEILLKNCELNNCSHFINIVEDTSIQIKNCIVNTPGVYFLNSDGWNQGVIGGISNTKIEFLHSDNVEMNRGFLDGIFDVGGSFNINNCKILGSETFDKEKLNSIIFNIPEANYKNCSFNSLNRCINRGASISECIFESCEKIMDNAGNLEIANCLFRNCENITIGSGFSIKNSQFVDCRNKIVTGDGITIEFCEFYNLVNDLTGFVPDACFQFTCGKNTPTNTISKCLFDGVKIDEGFLIQGNTFEKISGTKVFVKECDFRNCTTKRSTNVIVRQYHYYYGLFDKKVETNPVSISNCRGLDKVNEGKGYTDEVIIRSETPAGVKIGVAVAGAVAGWPGLVVGMGVAKLLKDNDFHKE